MLKTQMWQFIKQTRKEISGLGDRMEMRKDIVFRRVGVEREGIEEARLEKGQG